MSRWIVKIYWLISDIAVAVQALWICEVGYNAVRLGKVVKIRIIGAGNVILIIKRALIARA
jgi:hypothetical protein